MTVTTVFATAPGGDGTVLSTDIVYLTARSTAVGTFNDHIVGQNWDTVEYSCREAFIIFDTSGLPDTDDVSAVVLSLDGAFDDSTTNLVVTAASSAYNGGAVLTSDWIAGASLSGQTTYATWSSAGYSANYNAFTSAGAAFNTAINKTGSTALMLYSDRHSAATIPTGAETVWFTDADAAGTTTDPKLDITHAAAGGATVKTLAALGVGI